MQRGGFATTNFERGCGLGLTTRMVKGGQALVNRGVDHQNRKTARGKIPVVKRSNPICKLANSREEKETGTHHCQYKEMCRIGVDRLTKQFYRTPVWWFAWSTPGLTTLDRGLTGQPQSATSPQSEVTA